MLSDRWDSYEDTVDLRRLSAPERDRIQVAFYGGVIAAIAELREGTTDAGLLAQLQEYMRSRK